MRRRDRTIAAMAAAMLAVPLLLPVGAAVAQEGATTVTRQVVNSFDGTPIVTNLFLPAGASEDAPVPLVLETHGWGGTGRTAPGGLTGRLVDEGYAILTWDQRGFGCSGGEVRINDPQAEGKDVSALIDWAVEHAPILVEADDDPVVGMVGGSYAGGIQTAAASVDPRIDALAPEMSWSDLRHSLHPGGVVKQGWVTLLYAAGLATADTAGLDPACDGGAQVGGLDPAIHRGISEFLLTGDVSDATLGFFAGSSLAGYGDAAPVAVPTLVANSAVDTLFDVTDGYGIHEHVLSQGAPSRYLIYCGGHVSCPSTYADGRDTSHLREAVVDWFAEHLRGKRQGKPAPVVEYRTNEGVWRGLDAFPTVDDRALPVSGQAANLVVVPVLDVPDVATLVAELESSGGTLPATPLTAASVSRTGDPRAATFEVARAEEGPLELVGIPQLQLTVDGVLLDTLDQLPADLLKQVLDQISLDGLQVVGDAVDGLVGAVPIAGGLATGLTRGALGAAAGDVTPSDVNLFVKFVHRETGHVLNLQQGTATVDLTGGPTTVDVTMPGLAYTLPEGDHVDVQVSTAALTHATGRAPALLDVAIEGAVPVVHPSQKDAAPERPRGPAQRGVPPGEEHSGRLPAEEQGPPDQGPRFDGPPSSQLPARSVAAAAPRPQAAPLDATPARTAATPPAGRPATLLALTGLLILAAAMAGRGRWRSPDH